ncbi:YesL family protein [Evansella sp. AB-rgal1]|uniref:YesL family protein n=1 Tax=Evansella sp. AB-rgal1 TaxID=3242696 RepID=UPI00359E85A7
MQRSWLDSPSYTIADWIMRLALLNILWLCFTIIGIIVFGFMPATVAMFTVIRKLLKKEATVPLIKTFVSTYKKQFFPSNFIGLLLGIFGYVLLVAYTLLGTISGMMNTMLTFTFVFIGMFYISVVLISVPVYVEFELKFFDYFKQCILISFINPHIILFMATGIIGAYFIFTIIPGLTILVFGSIIATFMMWFTMLACNRVKKKMGTLEILSS